MTGTIDATTFNYISKRNLNADEPSVIINCAGVDPAYQRVGGDETCQYLLQTLTDIKW